MTAMSRIRWVVMLSVVAASALRGQNPTQGVQNATLRAALAAYDNLDITRAITLARQALSQRLAGEDQARAWELLGFAYSASDSLLKAVDAFKQAILIDPDRQLDPAKISPKITSSFMLALAQVLVVRQLQVDSTTFVAGQGTGGVPIRFTVTSPARVRTRAVSGPTSVVIDSSIATGQVNLRWPAQLANGDPVPAGAYLIIADAGAGQNTFSASQSVRITHGQVDTLPWLDKLPGYDYLPETEFPPQSGRPLAQALMYGGAAIGGTVVLRNSDLGSGGTGPALAVGAGALISGFIMSLKKPAAQPARANLLYNRLLREQLARRNAGIARENQTRRQQVRMTVAPVARGTR